MRHAVRLLTGILLCATSCAFGVAEIRWDDQAKSAAVDRGKFDLGCDELVATRLGAPQIATSHQDRVVGVEGCGRKAVYVSRCQLPNGLYSTDVACQAIMNSSESPQSK